jgi:hypothetical protein
MELRGHKSEGEESARKKRTSLPVPPEEESAAGRRRSSDKPREIPPFSSLSLLYFMHYTSKRGTCEEASAARQALDGQPRDFFFFSG